MMTARSKDAVGFVRLPFSDLFAISLIQFFQICLSEGLEK